VPDCSTPGIGVTLPIQTIHSTGAIGRSAARGPLLCFLRLRLLAALFHEPVGCFGVAFVGAEHQSPVAQRLARGSHTTPGERLLPAAGTGCGTSRVSRRRLARRDELREAGDALANVGETQGGQCVCELFAAEHAHAHETPDERTGDGSWYGASVAA
jgi:hypothetical protein